MSGRATARAKSNAKRKQYRFDARLDEDQKMLIERAADLEGRTVTEFVLRSAQEAAQRTIQQRAMLILTARETEAFVKALLDPAEPGPVLQQAAKRYRETLRP